MTIWKPIDKAPKMGPVLHKIDILGKIWNRDSDTFVFRRFTDCYWSIGDQMTNRKPGWKGLDDGFRAVAYMEIPEIPKEYP